MNSEFMTVIATEEELREEMGIIENLSGKRVKVLEFDSFRGDELGNSTLVSIEGSELRILTRFLKEDA